jgi:1-phosphatidylinositol phosphodiesterase
MGAGFNIQIVNATPYDLKRTYTHSYQMEWNPVDHVAGDSYAQFYGEFEETFPHFPIDDGASATYALDGVPGFSMMIQAKKKGVNGLPSPYPPSDAGYGVVVEWQNIPEGLVVYPPPDTTNHSSVGWIHDGVVTIAIGYFPGMSQGQISVYPTPQYGSGGLDDDLTALKPSVEHWAESWMDLYAPFIGLLTLTELTLPGTHDAGTYKADGVSQPWVQTQYLTLQQQLEQGVRALDIRLQVVGNDGDDRFQFCHGDVLTHLSFVDGLEQVIAFLVEAPNEIVVLDFHRFEKTWTTQDFQDLAGLIQNPDLLT